MESSNPSGKTPEPSPHRWTTNLLGTAIAILTLILPLGIIASFSTPPDANPLSNPSYSLKVLKD